jgi:hypothetical protein
MKAAWYTFEIIIGLVLIVAVGLIIFPVAVIMALVDKSQDKPWM